MGVIGLLTLISFFPALSNDFIDFDDPAFLTENPLVKDFSWSNTVKIFKQIPIVIYVPLTILSFNLEYTFFGLNPFVYHLNNLILHILNSCLILCILYRLSGRDLFVSFCAALLFGIHPLRVESVAWVAERKDVLYGFFYLLSLLCYLYHLLSKKIGVFYLLSVLCFILALLSKPMAVTIVPALFLIDFMMNRSWKEKKVYFDKGLYLFFTIIFLIMTVMSQKRAGQYYGLIFPSLQTLMRASDIIVFYLTKLISPVDLCVLYDFSHKPGYYLGNIPSIPIIILLSGALIIISRKSKLITFGGLFFILHIAPLLHIVSMGSQIVSDHFTYVAAIGFFLRIRSMDGSRL